MSDRRQRQLESDPNAALVVVELQPDEEVDTGEAERTTPRRVLAVQRGSTPWRLLVAGLWAASLVALIAPVLVLPVIEARLVTQFVALAVGLMGLQFVVGKGGMLSLCHGVFVGLGSYATTIAAGRYGLTIGLALLFAPIAAFLGGCLVGLLALRIRAIYLGPVTLAVAVAFPSILKRFDWFTGGSSGLPLPTRLQPPSWTGLDPNDAYIWRHLVIVGVAILAYLAMANLVRSPVGLAVQAMATGPIAAATSGVNVARYRVVAFGVGAAFGGLGGGLLTIDTPIVGADSYDLFRSLGYFAAVVVGGVAVVLGAAIGSAIVTGVPWILTTYGLQVSPNLVFGALLLIVMFVAPGGLAAALRDRSKTVLEVEDAPPEPIPDR